MRRFVGFVCMGWAAVGCAGVGPVQTEVEETVVEESAAVDEAPGSMGVSEVRWDEGSLQAAVGREIECTPVTVTEVRSQTYERRPAKNLGLSLVLSTAGVVSGLGAGVAYQQWSQTDGYRQTPEDALHPADVVALAGAAALLGGLYGYYRGFAVYNASRPNAVGEPVESTRRVATGATAICDTRPVDGRALVSFGEETIERGFVQGTIELAFREDEGLCPMTMLGEEVRVSYEADGTAGDVWKGDLDGCVHAHAAARLLDEVAEILAGEGDVSLLVRASSKLVEVEEHVAELDADDRDVERLARRVAELSEGVKSKAGDALKRVLVSLVADSKSGAAFEGLVTRGGEAIATARFLGEREEETLRRVHTAYARAISSPRDVVLLRERSTAFEKCLRGENCSSDGARESLRAAYEPFLGRLHGELKQGRSRLATDVKRLDAAELEASLSEKTPSSEWCEVVDWTDELDETCEGLVRERREAWAVVAEKEVAELERRQAATEKAWRSKFPMCRKVAAGLKAFEDMRRSDCGAPCRKAFNRLKSDHDELASFSPADPVWDSARLQAVRNDCRASGCPKCP